MYWKSVDAHRLVLIYSFKIELNSKIDSGFQDLPNFQILKYSASTFSRTIRRYLIWSFNFM